MSSLHDLPGSGEADLFGIQRLLSHSIALAASLVFALALLLLGISVGIVYTMAGSMVSEGMLKWSVRHWHRRFITRSINVVPSIVIAGAVGKDRLSRTINASQVILNVILPFVSAPLIYFTCFNRYMSVPVVDIGGHEAVVPGGQVPMRKSFVLSFTIIIVWLPIVVTHVAFLVMVGMGKSS